jgi:hypothetical protein
MLVSPGKTLFSPEFCSVFGTNLKIPKPLSLLWTVLVQSPEAATISCVQFV